MDSLPIAEDVEMSDNSAASVCDDRKRICTERSGSDESMSLSQVSNALDEEPKKQALNLNGIQNFKPTQLEIIEEGEFIWDFNNFNENCESPIFVIGGTPWKVKTSIHEKASGNKNFGLHLEVANSMERRDKNWAVCAEFILGAFNPNPILPPPQAAAATASPVPSLTSSTLSNMFSPLRGNNTTNSLKSTSKELVNGHSQYVFHRFCADEADWGFSQFCSLNAFKNGIPDNHVIPLANSDGLTSLIVKIRLVKDSTGVLWHNFTNYDSKAVTGFVGLLNQGATCYMNSFVQSIFLTNEFRSAVYKIPTENVSPTSSIPLALQRIFYKLQTSQQPPSTIEMTKSFGWDTTESFMQHDVQEFSRVLMDDLENKMKGTEVEGTVERLFRGKLKNVLKCTEVDYESVREEFFYDLQLTIKGYKDLKESFERYVTAEMLCGDNQYRTDDFGLQDAKKFVTFEHFPPVLHIHLERYAFDMMAEATVKIHDRFEFPSEIALDPYLSETSPDRANSQEYWLHSVLVYAGDGHGGHYFVYIRHPSKPDCWYKFDDTKVTPCSEREALDENFGGYEAVSSEEALELQRSTGVKPYRYKKFTSAYLLVYIRKSELNTVLAPVEESSIPEYLVERIKADDIAEGRRRHERQQQFLTMNLTIINEVSMKNYSGSDLFDPESEENVFKIKRDLAIQDVVEEVLNDFIKVPEYSSCDGIECYTLVGRRNKTIRTDALMDDLETRTVGSLNNRMSTGPTSIFVRLTDSSAELSGDLWRQPLTEGKALIFFKWYNPLEDKLMILGSMPIDREQSISSVEPLIRLKLDQFGIDFEGELAYNEEFKPSKIIKIDVESGKTFKEADLRNGDIIIIEPKNEKVRTVNDYFGDLLSWRQVDIKPVNPHQSRAVFENIKISTKWKLSDVLNFIGKLLEVDPEHLRIVFTSESNCVSSGVELVTDDNGSGNSNITPATNNINNYPQFLNTNNEGTVNDFLNGTSSIDIITLKYEITEEVASKAEDQVRYFIEPASSSSCEILPIAIYLTPYVSTVGDLIKKVAGEDKLMKFRLLQVLNGKIKRTFSVGSSNESLTPVEPEKCSLYLEEINNENSDDSKLISCFTFEKNPSKPFGVPFKFEIKPEESVKSLKTRLAQKLSVTPESLTLFLFSGSRDRKLEDASEILFNLPGVNFSDEDHLAIMTIDPRKQRSSSGFDGAIRFRK